MKTLLTSVAAIAILGGAAFAQDAMKPATPPADATPDVTATPAAPTPSISPAMNVCALRG